jgi:hypothetical protein
MIWSSETSRIDDLLIDRLIYPLPPSTNDPIDDLAFK